MGFCQAVFSADWNNDYGVTIKVGQDDNFRLAEDDEIETASTELSVFADLEAATEISATRLALGARGNNYSESEIDESESYRLSLFTSRQGERLSGNLSLSFESETTTETELLDSGNVVDGERETAKVAPGANYRIDERNYVFGNLSATDVTYDIDSLTEYTNSSISLGWGYQFDETSEFTVSLSATEYDPEDGDTTDIGSARLGYTWQTSEATAYNASIGYSDVDRPGDSETGNTLGFGVEHEVDERNRLTISYDNSYQGSGTGDVREEDQLNLDWLHGLSDRTDINFSVAAIDNDDREYYSLEFGGSYRYSREVSLRGNVRYREQESDTTEADSSGIFFSLTYSPI